MNKLKIKAAVLGITVMYLLCPLAVSAEGETEAVTEISDAAGLAAVAEAPGGSYRLTEDIYLEEDWQPIPFSGKLDGGGHTVYNMHVTSVDQEIRVTTDGNLKHYKTEFAGLFSVMENAEVSELHIRGALVEIADRSNCFAALLAGFSQNSVVTGCSVEGRVHLMSSGINAGVAGIAGYGSGIFKECGADVELVFEDRFRNGKCEQFLGGILASGVAEFRNCRVKINGYDSCHGFAHNGGIVGMFYFCDGSYLCNCILDCRVEGQITFFEDNADRRAYCEPLAGELLATPNIVARNTSSFRSNEVKVFARVLSPEQCDEPDYEETVVPGGCATPGYTEHTCRGCGYSWVDSYARPAHEAGEWETVSESDYEREGLERQRCAKCGAVLCERAVPVKVRTEGVAATGGGHIPVIRITAVCSAVAIMAVGGLLLFISKKSKKSKT